MKTLLLSFVTIAFLSLAVSAEDSRSLISPEILPSGNVAFHLKAPKAHEVTVRGQWTKDPLKLSQEKDGVWSGETAGIPRGLWEYSFIVDGLNVLDPLNPAIKPMREPHSSILNLPSTPPAPWDFQDVPHGIVHQHSYLSKALGRPRELVVYTPPGYDADQTTRFPLLVLQHGSGDNQATWTILGKAHWILDSLIAAGQAQPMVVLMIDGHPLNSLSKDPAKRSEAMQAFQRELFEDALPLVEQHYRVEKEASSRAIAGLSMGGGQALHVGLTNLDRFAWVISFSGATPEGEFLKPVLADPAAVNQKLRLLWIGVGKDDFLRARNEEFTAQLKAGGVAYQWHLSEGGHSWPVWRDYLVKVAPLLFQPAKQP